MRTKVNIDDDVRIAAKAIAKAAQSSVGAVLLTGINPPAGTPFNRASLIRGNVNTVFGATY